MGMNVKLFIYKPFKLTAENLSVDDATFLLESIGDKFDRIVWYAVDVSTGMRLNMNNGEWVLKEE